MSFFNIYNLERINGYLVTPWPWSTVQEAVEKAVELARQSNEIQILVLNDYILRFVPCSKEKGAVLISYKRRK